MTTGIGKPVIRGMTHYRVVTTRQRAAHRDAGVGARPLPERGDGDRRAGGVIKGPASVLYGSDALGGVVNVVAPPVPDALDGPRFARGRMATTYNHNDRGADGTLAARGRRRRLRRARRGDGRGSGDMSYPAARSRPRQSRARLRGGGRLPRTARAPSPRATPARRAGVEIFDDPAASPGLHRLPAYRDPPRDRGARRRRCAGARLQANVGYVQKLSPRVRDAAATDPDLGLFVRQLDGVRAPAPRAPRAASRRHARRVAR
jgi:iron complex outermembrane receptor protein